MSALKRISNPPNATLNGNLSSDSEAVRRGGHPLPEGMRDLLPPEARQLSRVGRRVSDSFALSGYQRVTLPSFEYASVLEKARGAMESAGVLRFVEPETGEIVALRPDMTLQVARLVSNRLQDVPMPARLSYHGSVLRRRHERARLRRQVTQAGFELVGVAGLPGDLEVLQLIVAAAVAAGLSDFTVDIAHAGIASALVNHLEPERQKDVLAALITKDSAELEQCLASSRLDAKQQRALVELPRLQGGAELWPQAEQVLRGTAAEPAMLELRALWDRAVERGLEDRLLLDLGEPPSFEYYTGPVYQLLAGGPGEAIGAGGRYDKLYELFGVPHAAAGFAFDLGNLCWALRKAGVTDQQDVRFLVASDDPELAVGLVAALRASQLSCVAHSRRDALQYAYAWHYQYLLVVEADRVRLQQLTGETATPVFEQAWAASQGTDTMVAKIRSALGR